ncbi:hypothetical protein WA026_021042 [Henosepilachna vigintioctopunctata]|uniref:Uncharacterized protein n=1 Tax=Henosepilachna vigintioctopunctata TaxID=420089 RepID=A0AAW1UXN9_9CUCU
MNQSSPGPLASRAISRLSPKAQKTIDNITHNKYSWADVAELQFEIAEVEKQAERNNGKEMTLELESFSQNFLTSLSKNHENKNRIIYTYNSSDLGPFIVYVEGKNGNMGMFNH